MKKVAYGVSDSPFGPMVVAQTDAGVCWLGFARQEAQGGTKQAAQDDAVRVMQERFPHAQLFESVSVGKRLGDDLIRAWRMGTEEKIPLDLYGTDFQKRVWQALHRIEKGATCSYSDIAKALGNAQAQRAVGTAVGRNPVSLIVPCHRVIHKDGHIGHYYWGSGMKQAILAEEDVLLLAA